MVQAFFDKRRGESANISFAYQSTAAIPFIASVCIATSCSIRCVRGGRSAVRSARMVKWTNERTHFGDKPGLKKVAPDLLVHGPGDTDLNHAMIEVKPVNGQLQGILKDLCVLAALVNEVRYSRAIYLFYGAGLGEQIVDVVRRTAVHHPISFPDSPGSLLPSTIARWNTSSTSLLRLRPNPRPLPIAKKLKVDHVGIATDRAVFHIRLFATARPVQRDDDPLAAGRAGIRPLVHSPTPFPLPLPHQPMLARS